MRKTSTYIKSLFLAILIFVAFGAKEMHHFFGHAHEEVKICDAKQGEKHLHNEEYIHQDCNLCDFTFSYFEIPLLGFNFKKPKIALNKTEFSFYSIICTRIHFFKSLRGPPCVEA